MVNIGKYNMDGMGCGYIVPLGPCLPEFDLEVSTRKKQASHWTVGVEMLVFPGTCHLTLVKISIDSVGFL